MLQRKLFQMLWLSVTSKIKLFVILCGVGVKRCLCYECILWVHSFGNLNPSEIQKPVDLAGKDFFASE